MKIVAIIAEYNPFHLGHKYQIEKIREEFGKDTIIIAIMSGNFTQRGEVAITDKKTRAAAAVLSGVNMVLELPFPFSISSADYFARAAVKIVNDLGFVDCLCFGSESGDINILRKTAQIMLSDGYKQEFKKHNTKNTGYAKATELTLKSMLGDSVPDFTPNNILAIEYIKALISSDSKVAAYTIKRTGSGYNDNTISATYPSAMAIRNEVALNGRDIDFDTLLPSETCNLFNTAMDKGDMPASDEKLSAAIISYFRLNPVMQKDILDAGDGLYNRLRASALSANSISNLLKLSETKKYTNAKLRRVVWYSFFGVTSSDMNELPAYTQLLALDINGMSLLHSYGKDVKIPILTKPSCFKNYGPCVIKQKTLADGADSIYELSKPIPKSGKSPLTMTPFIKK